MDDGGPVTERWPEARIARAALGYPTWTYVRKGAYVYVVVDHDCPEEEAAANAAAAVVASSPDEAIAHPET